MFNFKASGIAAGTAFVVSLFLGLVSGSGFPALLFRALGFGVLFFVLSCLVFWLLGQFVPELLSGSDDLFDAPGSRVNISVGSEPIEGAFPPGDTDEMDNIDGGMPRAFPGRLPVQAGENADFSVSTVEALDQDDEEGYNRKGPVSAGETSGKGTGRNSGEADLVPDFDTLSEAFLPDSGLESPEPVVFDMPEPRKTGSNASASRGFSGDFDPKELAQAIKTVLKKDEKG
jgi:hypothetical protein